MPVLILPRSRFVHVPKTGGSWVAVAIENAGIGAETIIGSPPLAEVPNPELFTFAFVRHPLTWWQSLWRFWAGIEPRRRHHSLLQVVFLEDFEWFIEEMLETVPGECSRFFGRYVSGIDFVGRQESLEDDLVRALRLAGEEFDEGKLRATPRVNVSDRKWRAEYTPGLRTAVLGAEREVIERFGYGPCGKRDAETGAGCSGNGAGVPGNVPADGSPGGA